MGVEGLRIYAIMLPSSGFSVAHFHEHIKATTVKVNLCNNCHDSVVHANTCQIFIFEMSCAVITFSD